jgi:cyclase
MRFPLIQGVTGVDVAGPPMNKDNVKHVYQELTGKIDHERLGISPAPLDWRAGPNGVSVAGR